MSDPVILFDPWPRTASLIFAGDLHRRFERLGRAVGIEESASGRLASELIDATLWDVVAIVGQTDLDAAHIAPVFAQPMAEMALDLARGITRGDRSMREGREQYGLAGNRDAFLLRGATIGFIGCRNLGRALIPLLASFRPRLLIHDPWLPDSVVRELGGEPASLDAALREPRVIFALAGWTEENRGRLLFSSHRAGGLPATFAAIGEMVVDDLQLILRGPPPQRRQSARPETVSRWRNPPGRRYAPGTRL